MSFKKECGQYISIKGILVEWNVILLAFRRANDKEIQSLNKILFYYPQFHTIECTTLHSTVLRNSVQVRSLQKEMDEQEQHMTNRIRKLEQTIK